MNAIIAYTPAAQRQFLKNEKRLMSKHGFMLELNQGTICWKRVVSEEVKLLITRPNHNETLMCLNDGFAHLVVLVGECAPIWFECANATLACELADTIRA